MLIQSQHCYPRHNAEQADVLHRADGLFRRAEQSVFVYQKAACQHAADACHQQQSDADFRCEKCESCDERAADNAPEPRPPRAGGRENLRQVPAVAQQQHYREQHCRSRQKREKCRMHGRCEFSRQQTVHRRLHSENRAAAHADQLPRQQPAARRFLALLHHHHADACQNHRQRSQTQPRERVGSRAEPAERVDKHAHADLSQHGHQSRLHATQFGEYQDVDGQPVQPADAAQPCPPRQVGESVGRYAERVFLDERCGDEVERPDGERHERCHKRRADGRPQTRIGCGLFRRCKLTRTASFCLFSCRSSVVQR